MAQVHVGGITATVTPATGAQVHVGQITAVAVPAGTGGARVHVGEIVASATSPQTTPAGEFTRKAGAWVPRTPRKRKGGAWVASTRRTRTGSGWKGPTPTPPVVVNPPSDIPGFTLLVNDEFATIDRTRWNVRDNDTYGADGGRLQRYMARNAVVSPASDGIGLSLKMIAKRESVGGNAFTAAMFDTQRAGWLLPCYHCKELEAKISQGQGVWQAWWSTAFNGGADLVELDDLEGFWSQIPGRALFTLHRRNNAKLYQGSVIKSRGSDGYSGIFFEKPTLNPGWHKFRTKVYPVTDATGATPGDPTKPSSFVRFQAYIDGVLVLDKVDDQALHWTSTGGDPADPLGRFWNVYLQGSQIDGKYVGHPDDPLGYSHLLPGCISGSGTPPNACPTSVNGIAIPRATFPNTFEIKRHTVWEYTG